MTNLQGKKTGGIDDGSHHEPKDKPRKNFPQLEPLPLASLFPSHEQCEDEADGNNHQCTGQLNDGGKAT